MNKLKKGDQVIVTAGNDKGKIGTILKVIFKKPKKKDKKRKQKADLCYYVVEGVRMMKKHVRPNPNEGEKGGIHEKEAPIHHSNVKLYNAAENRGERVGFKALEDGQKVRVYKSTGDVVEA